MRLVIPTPRAECPAFYALRNEGLQPELMLCEDPFAYGRLIRELWDDGGFVLVEHDVVPWPGAVKLLMDCSSDVCVHEYPVGGGSLGHSLGCTKFSDGFVASTDISGVEHVPWQTVDLTLWRNLGDVPRHPHEPPVAHVRDLDILEQILAEHAFAAEARTQLAP